MTSNHHWLKANKTASFSMRILCALIALFFVFASFTSFVPENSSSTSSSEKSAEAQLNFASNIANLANVELKNSETSTVDNSELVKRCAVTIIAYGEAKQFVIGENTVENILKTVGVTPDKNDVISQKKENVVEDNSTIKVDDVEKKLSTETEMISYNEYLKLATDSDEIAKTSDKIKMTSKYRVTYVNGESTDKELVDRSFEKIESAKQVVKTVAKKTTSTTVKKTSSKETSSPIKVNSDGSVKYDSSKAISPLKPSFDLMLDKNGVPLNYKKVYTGKGTAYTGDEWTASGRRAGVGYIAVNPKEIPYGTKLYVRSSDGKYDYGYCIAADTGGFVNMGRLVDLYFSTESECSNFGVRKVEVYVLS